MREMKIGSVTLKEWKKIFLTWSLEHVQHSLSDCKSTSDVDGGDKGCDGWQGLDGVGGSVAPTHQKKSSNSCDSRDSVCHRHKRWVESWCNTPYCVVTWKQHNTHSILVLIHKIWNKKYTLSFLFLVIDDILSQISDFSFLFLLKYTIVGCCMFLLYYARCKVKYLTNNTSQSKCCNHGHKSRTRRNTTNSSDRP